MKKIKTSTLDDKIKKGLANAYNIELTLFNELENLNEQLPDFPKSPEMPFAFDLGCVCCRNGEDSLAWYKIDSAGTGIRRPIKTATFHDCVNGYALNEPLLSCRNIRTASGREIAFCIQKENGDWEESRHLKNSEVTKLEKTDGQIFVQYVSGHKSRVARIVLDGLELKIENVENIKGILGEFGDYIVAESDTGLVKLEKGTLQKATEFEHSKGTLAKVKVLEKDNVISASDYTGTICFWDLTTNKKIGEEHKTKNKAYEILKDEDFIYLYSINNENKIEVKKCKTISDLVNNSPDFGANPYDLEQKHVIDICLREDRDSKIPYLLIITDEKEVIVLSKELEYRGKIQFEESARFLEKIYFVDEVE